MRARLRALASGNPAGRPGRAPSPTAAQRPGGPPRDAPERAERVGPDTFEWRMRESDGPTDRGHYACACGFQFAARVDTAVHCPHCGAAQAW